MTKQGLFRRFEPRRFSIVFAVTAAASLALAAALPRAAHAQIFDNRFPFDQRRWRQPQQPPAPQGGFFSFPFFGRSFPDLTVRRPAPAPLESLKAPPPRKLETQPTTAVVVIGDSLADWLAYGLEEVYADSPEIGVVRKIRPTSGLVRYEPRSDSPEWSQAVKDILATEKPNAIVVMLGLNDRLPLREPPPSASQPAHVSAQGSVQGQEAKPAAQSASASAPQAGEQPAAAGEAQRSGHGGPSYEFRTDQWAEIYSKRIDDMIAALKTKGVPVLWVGLPAIRGPRATSDMNYLDELYRARAEKAGIVYVDIWDGFVDENGRYSAQGPDFEGQTRRLRAGDGIHFTKVGAVKLAHFVEHELSRVMSSPVVPVALPSPEEKPPAKPGAAPAAVGPVLPLTATGGGEGDELVGSGNRPAPIAYDPLAARVLSRGDAVAAPAGRADDFAWPHPGTNADETLEATPQPAARAAPPAPTKKASAARKDAKSP